MVRSFDLCDMARGANHIINLDSETWCGIFSSPRCSEARAKGTRYVSLGQLELSLHAIPPRRMRPTHAEECSTRTEYRRYCSTTGG